MSEDLECPYCNEPNEVNHDDGEGYEEDTAHEMQCSSCHKNFVFHTAISYTYLPVKADCLNGLPHTLSDWQYLWERSGVITESRYCKVCNYREQRKRQATNA